MTALIFVLGLTAMLLLTGCDPPQAEEPPDLPGDNGGDDDGLLLVVPEGGGGEAWSQWANRVQ